MLQIEASKEIIPSMLSELVARLVCPGFKFGVDDPAQAEALVDLGVGGFCLYGGQIEEVSELTSRLRRRAKEPLIFNADYEDGVASQCPGGTELPSNMGIGACGSEQLALQKGLLTAVEACALGVRWVLAPVVDLALEPDNPIVNIRSFGRDPVVVGKLAKAYCAGLGQGGAMSCLKHFPGHGRSRLDSHLEMPSITASRAELAEDLAPFQAAASGADSLMTGHLSVPALEPEADLPFSLSQAVGREVRRAFSFEGLISTDALTMRAVSHHFDELLAAEKALLGGSDILLVPGDAKRLVYHLMSRVDSDPQLAAAVASSLKRWGRAVKKFGGAEPEAGSLARVASPEHKAQALQMAEACLAAVKSPVSVTNRIRYAEPGNSPEEWQAQSFISELKTLGAEVSPAGGPLRPGETLVLGCVLTPRAYTGRIAFDADGEISPAQALLSAAKNAVIVSFGSPFVFEVFRDWASGLCSFSANKPAQIAAARGLLGRLAVTGRMPVPLRLA